MKKQGYKVYAYDEDKYGLKTDVTILHFTDVNPFVEELFNSDLKIREVVVRTSPRSNSYISRVHVYTKKGR